MLSIQVTAIHSNWNIELRASWVVAVPEVLDQVQVLVEALVPVRRCYSYEITTYVVHVVLNIKGKSKYLRVLPFRN